MRHVDPAILDDVGAFRLHAHFVSVDPVKNRYRFYTLRWHPTLFGEWALVRTWGRLGTKGRSRMLQYPDQDSGREAAQAIIKRRIQRGYHLVAWD